MRSDSERGTTRRLKQPHNMISAFVRSKTAVRASQEHFKIYSTHFTGSQVSLSKMGFTDPIGVIRSLSIRGNIASLMGLRSGSPCALCNPSLASPVKLWASFQPLHPSLSTSAPIHWFHRPVVLNSALEQLTLDIPPAVSQ